MDKDRKYLKSGKRLYIWTLLIVLTVSINRIAIHAEELHQEDMDINTSKMLWVDESFLCDLSMSAEGFIEVTIVEDNNYGCTLTKDGVVYKYLSLPEGTAVLPLSIGSGEYELMAVRHIAGKQYEVLADYCFYAELTDELSPYKKPNLLVNYDHESSFAETAENICRGKSAQQAASSVCQWVWKNIKYDFIRSFQIRENDTGLSQNIPQLEQVFERHMGICLEQASLAAAMLRLAGIPAKLTVGKHKGLNHAWVYACTGLDKWLLLDPSNNNIGDDKEYIPEMFY